MQERKVEKIKFGAHIPYGRCKRCFLCQEVIGHGYCHTKFVDKTACNLITESRINFKSVSFGIGFLRHEIKRSHVEVKVTKPQKV